MSGLDIVHGEKSIDPRRKVNPLFCIRTLEYKRHREQIAQLRQSAIYIYQTLNIYSSIYSLVISRYILIIPLVFQRMCIACIH